MLKLRKKYKKYILGMVYRPLKLSEENYRILYDEIKSVIKDKNAVICGDLNNSVNWSTLTADREGTRLLELTEEAFLYQIVQTPTRGNNIATPQPLSALSTHWCWADSWSGYT